MKRFCKENIKIFNCSNSVVVQAFRKDVLIRLGLFVELTKMVPQTIEEAYEKAREFVNLERELKLAKQESPTMPIALREREKKEMSPEKTRPVEYPTNKRFARQDSRWSNSWNRNFGPW